MVVLSVSFSLLRASPLEHVLAGEAWRWCGVASTALTMTSLSSVPQWGLDEGIMTMDTHISNVMSGIVAMSQYSPDKFIALISLEDGLAEKRQRWRLLIVCLWCMLMVFWMVCAPGSPLGGLVEASRYR